MSQFALSLDFPLGPVPEGLTYLADFISPKEEARLLALIDAGHWTHEYKRRRQHHGACYHGDTAGGGGSRALPDWLARLAAEVAQAAESNAVSDHALINEYLPGQGIAPHIDRGDAPRGIVTSLSLGSGCEMQFRQRTGGDATAKYLEPRSLVILRGAARHDWTHGIAPRRSDPMPWGREPRARRVSITFRMTPVDGVSGAD